MDDWRHGVLGHQQTHVNIFLFLIIGDHDDYADYAGGDGDDDLGDFVDNDGDISSPDVPSEKRVRRWAVSLENIIMDPLGVEVNVITITITNVITIIISIIWGLSSLCLFADHFHSQELFSFLKKEYCHENLRFWLSVQELKRGPGSEQKIKKKVKEIYEWVKTEW